MGTGKIKSLLSQNFYIPNSDIIILTEIQIRTNKPDRSLGGTHNVSSRRVHIRMRRISGGISWRMYVGWRVCGGIHVGRWVGWWVHVSWWIYICGRIHVGRRILVRGVYIGRRIRGRINVSRRIYMRGVGWWVYVSWRVGGWVHISRRIHISRWIYICGRVGGWVDVGRGVHICWGIYMCWRICGRINIRRRIDVCWRVDLRRGIRVRWVRVRWVRVRWTYIGRMDVNRGRRRLGCTRSTCRDETGHCGRNQQSEYNSVECTDRSLTHIEFNYWREMTNF